MKQCPSCGRQLEDQYQFCPFDRTPLGKKCPVCGKSWAPEFQFCPIDSSPLADAAAAPETLAAAPPRAVEPARVPPAPPPPRSAASWEEAAPLPAPSPRPVEPPPPVDFSFIAEETAKTDWTSKLLRPAAVVFVLVVLVVVGTVFFLTESTGGGELPLPTVRYELMPNEGKGKGVPVVIKVNQLAVFLIDDPMEDGAKRAQQVVTSIEEILRHAKGDVGLRFAVETKEGRPALVVVTQAGPDPKILATVTEGDAALAGETEAARVAARWAERLTDAVKLYVFGEAPTFSKGTEFGDILSLVYKASLDSRGHPSKKSLDRAFQQLTLAQRAALEAPPRAR